MNKVILIGRTTKDIELKNAGSTQVVNFTLAINRDFKDKSGERQADFIGCTAFGKTAELISQYVFKGHRLGVIGAIQNSKFTSKDGKEVTKTTVIVESIEFLQEKQTANNQSYEQNYQQKDSYTPSYQQPYQQPKQENRSYQQNKPLENVDNFATITDDDLPF